MDLVTLALAKKYADKQRLGYAEKAEEPILSDIKLVDLGLDMPGVAFNVISEDKLNGFVPVYGEYYRVKIANQSWDCYCRSESILGGNNSTLVIGNMGFFGSLMGFDNLPDTGEDFFIYYNPEDSSQYYKGTLHVVSKSEGDFSISIIKDKYSTVDSKYLDFINSGRVIIPTTSLVSMEGEEGVTLMQFDATIVTLVEGKTYNIKLGDDIYTEVCKSAHVEGFDSNALFLGNPNIVEADDPNILVEKNFCVFQSPDGFGAVADLGCRNSVCLVEQDTVDTKYLHFFERNEKVVLPEISLNVVGNTSLYSSNQKLCDLVVGKTYRVYRDSGSCDFLCKSFNTNSVYLGNSSITEGYSTGENFLFLYEGDKNTTVIYDMSSSKSVAITEVQETINPKYTPGVLPIVELTTPIPLTPEVGTQLSDSEVTALENALSKSSTLVLTVGLDTGNSIAKFTGTMLHVHNGNELMMTIFAGDSIIVVDFSRTTHTSGTSINWIGQCYTIPLSTASNLDSKEA